MVAVGAETELGDMESETRRVNGREFYVIVSPQSLLRASVTPQHAYSLGASINHHWHSVPQ